MFCQTANQSFEKVAMEDVELQKTVAEMKDWGLLEGEAEIVNRRELGKFLIDQQGKIKAGQSLTLAQRAVLDRALSQIFGRSIFY